MKPLSLRTLAAKNVRHRAQSYAAFFLSSAFAVWLFYLYASLLQHPHFRRNPLPPSFEAGMRAIELVVGGFSVLFIIHAHAAFLKARKKELALMAILGMRPAQIARTIHLENAMVGLAATAAGMLLGTACLRLFFLAFSRVIGLRQPVPFHLSLEAIGLTALVFAGVFGVISAYSHAQLRRASVAELLRAAQVAPPVPRLSRWQAVAGLLALGGAYAILLTTKSPWESAARMLWSLGLLLAGTYLLFTQSSILLLGWLRANRAIYYRETNLVTISQLAARLRSNARMLFVISILTTGVLLPLGLFALQYRNAERSVLHGDPVGLMVVGEPAGLTPARAAAILREHGLHLGGEAHVPVLAARSQDAKHDPWPAPTRDVLVMPAGGFDRWLQDVLGKAPFALETGKAAVVERWGGTGGAWTTIHLELGNDVEPLPIFRSPRFLGDEEKEIEPFNVHPLTWMVVVADDATFARLHARYGAAHGSTLHGYALPQWKQSSAAVGRIEREAGAPAPELLVDRETGPVTASIRTLEEGKQSLSFSLFLTSFVGLLFFLATGNMLYFTLFTQLAEDRRQFQALHKLGLGPRQVRRIVSIQTAVLFFVPFLVGLAHAAGIVRLFASAFRASLWEPMALVGAGYGLLLAGYYLVTRRTYVRTLLGDRHDGRPPLHASLTFH